MQTEFLQIDALIVFPGERYDVHIRGLNEPTKRVYRFIIETMEYFEWDWSLARRQIGLANLVYEDAKGDAAQAEDDGKSERKKTNKNLARQLLFASKITVNNIERFCS